MFKYRNFVTNVYSYDLSDKEIYYISTDKEIIGYENGVRNNILKLSCLCHILLFQDKLYISDTSDLINNYCIDLKSNEIVRNFSVEGIKALNLSQGHELGKIGLFHVDGSWSIYDIKEDKIVFTLKPVEGGRFSLLNLFEDEYSFIEVWGVEKLHCYNQSTKLWELDLSGYGRLKKIFGIVDNVLWLWCEDYYFIGVDVFSGSIKKVWEVFDGVYERGRFYFYYPYFDKEEGKIYFFERNSYIECDLRNYATEILWRDKELNENISGPHFTNDYIYFTSSRLNSVFNDRLGVFDRKKMQIIWKEKFDLSQGAGFKIPNVVGDFLYVHDTGNTLHIYEKSDTSLS